MIVAALLVVSSGVVVGDVPESVRVLAVSGRLLTAVVAYDAGGAHHVALVRSSGSDEIETHDDPCGEGASAKKAKDAVSAALTKHDVREFGLSCNALPTVVKASSDGSLRVTVAGDGKAEARTVSVDGVPVFVTHDDDGKAPAATYVVNGVYGHVVLDAGESGFRIAGALPKEANNGVDVAALSAIGVADPCGVSVVSNVPLADTVAVTVAYALRSKAAITTAQTTREKSVVYASDKCGDVAKTIAAKVPGGAAVEKLTWKPAGNAGIVVALGETATPK